MRKIAFWMMTMAAIVAVGSASAGIDTAGIDTAGIDTAGIDTAAGAGDIGVGDSGIGNNSGGIYTITRKGRTVQVDGFLLEWDAGNARRWAGTPWRWDAAITAQGVAGYFSHPGSGSWTFTITAVNTKKSFAMTIPKESFGKHFAFDKGTFDSTGALTAEWLVPWSFFEDEDGNDGDVDTYTMMFAGAGGADELPPMEVSVASPRAPRAPAGKGTQAVMIAVTAVLTVVLALHRRRKIREFGQRQEKS